jgi:hypothetical protein
MPNTTNYSFPTPADTDLVKNGADAIRDLGDAVDTAMNTALGTKKAGMVLLNTTSFSGVTSVSLPSATFSASYANYKLYFSGLATTAAQLTGRMRVSGADNATASSYVTERIIVDGAATGFARFTDTFFLFGDWDTTLVNAVEIDLVNPFAASATGMLWRTLRSTSGAYVQQGVGTHNQNVSYDSLTLLANNNITGNVRVYGYNQ